MEKDSKKLGNWINSELPQISSKLEKMNDASYLQDYTISFSGKERVKKILFHFRSALFPGIYEKCTINKNNLDLYIGNNIREAAMELREIIKQAFRYCCNNKECDQCPIDPDQLVIDFLKTLPDIRRKLQTDIEAAYLGDPAAKSHEEIMLSYPSLEMMSIHRIANELYKLDIPLVPRMMNEYGHRVTGIDIHPGASIGEYFFMDHGTGIVIGETAVIGNNVKIYQGVTLGARSFELDDQGNPIKGTKRHPNIEDNVIIYSHATILGGDTVIGHNSIIGASVWLMQSVPPHSKIYNNLGSKK